VRRFARPRPLERDDPTDQFRCGIEDLDLWLRRRAWPNEAAGSSRTFVTHEVGRRPIIGYYTIAAASVVHDGVPSRRRRNAPDPVPAVLLGRLAVDQRFQGQGLGSSMVRDAIVRAVAAATQIGITVMIVDAQTDKAAHFYRQLGFVPFPPGAHTHLARIKDLRLTLGQP
jgi:ribosomal protein S18 acetylase RimI-like enzyme